NTIVNVFNPEDCDVSQVFDFGSALAFQKVSVTVALTVAGSWDTNAVSTHDIMTVSANGEPLQTYNYTSSNSDYNSAIARGESVEKLGAKTYTYEVTLDENGQAQLEFMVASTATDEIINVNSITAHYEGFTGYVQSVQETQTYMETVFVDAPDTLVNPADIAGGVPMVMENQSVEVDAEPIMTTQEVVVGFEYDISYHVGLNDTDGSETLGNLTMSNLPDGSQLQDANGEAVMPNEDGSYTLDTQPDSTVSMTLVSTQEIAPEQFDSMSASITSTDIDDSSTATMTVTGDSESINLSGLADLAEDSDHEAEESLSGEIALSQVFTLDQDPSIALFEEDLSVTTTTAVQSDTSSSSAAELQELYNDASDSGLVVEAPIEIAAT
ncbi:MAG: hypothetical protein Q8M43_06555, partial [Sulfuricurvum sp.]|uniref:hypothetical protein n=1 Tax=Sulfuricurvum sp. TaxID=2025608 RepID=UPI002735D41B